MYFIEAFKDVINGKANSVVLVATDGSNKKIEIHRRDFLSSHWQTGTEGACYPDPVGPPGIAGVKKPPFIKNKRGLFNELVKLCERCVMAKKAEECSQCEINKIINTLGEEARKEEKRYSFLRKRAEGHLLICTKKELLETLGLVCSSCMVAESCTTCGVAKQIDKLYDEVEEDVKHE